MSKVKTVRISRTKAKEIMMNSGGRFITTTHKTEKGDMRTINGRFHGFTSLGNIRVVENGGKGFKGVKLDELTELKANKQIYRVR